MFESLKKWMLKKLRPKAATLLEERIRVYESEEWIRWMIEEYPGVREALADPDLREVEIRTIDGKLNAVAKFSPGWTCYPNTCRICPPPSK